MNAVRVVLVRTEVEGNIGAVARLVSNFGAGQLVLVDPQCDPLGDQARRLAAGAVEVLQQARQVPDLAMALADCVASAATSALTGGLFRRQSVVTPAQAAQQLVRDLNNGPVALVFGPEPVGLSNDEIRQCQSLIHIPTHSRYPALNLAQAVAVCLYQLHETWRTRTPEPATPVANHEELERAWQALEQGLHAIGYLRGSRGPALLHALRHLLSRARPSPMEARLLLGLGRQMQWRAAQDEATSSSE
jgi:tRNA/rRNA methyltransferase